MQRHQIDPLSALLGAFTVAFGIGVMTNALRRFDLDAGWLAISFAGALGALLVVVAVQRLAEERRSGGDAQP